MKVQVVWGCSELPDSWGLFRDEFMRGVHDPEPVRGLLAKPVGKRAGRPLAQLSKFERQTRRSSRGVNVGNVVGGGYQMARIATNVRATAASVLRRKKLCK